MPRIFEETKTVLSQRRLISNSLLIRQFGGNAGFTEAAGGYMYLSLYFSLRFARKTRSPPRRRLQNFFAAVPVSTVEDVSRIPVDMFLHPEIAADGSNMFDP